MHSERPQPKRQQTRPEPGPDAATRAGFVALAGLPNAGKSTLLNALVGERLCIVGPRAQTTWQRVAGVRTSGNAQMVLVDAPGIVGARRRLIHWSMAAETAKAVRDADAVVGVVDGADRRVGRREEALVRMLAECGRSALVAVAKADARGFDPGRGIALADGLGLGACVVSARSGLGLDDLAGRIEKMLPPGPFLYPEDQVAAAPTRFFAQELIREAVFEHCREEVPYAVAVQVEEFREAEDPVYVAAVLHVERKSQKGLVVGAGGARIKAVGRSARRKIERLLGRRVYLDLWVKVTDGWRRKRKALRALGYAVPDDAG